MSEKFRSYVGSHRRDQVSAPRDKQAENSKRHVCRLKKCQAAAFTLSLHIAYIERLSKRCTQSPNRSVRTQHEVPCTHARTHVRTSYGDGEPCDSFRIRLKDATQYVTVLQTANGVDASGDSSCRLPSCRGAKRWERRGAHTHRR